MACAVPLLGAAGLAPKKKAPRKSPFMRLLLKLKLEPWGTLTQAMVSWGGQAFASQDYLKRLLDEKFETFTFLDNGLTVERSSMRPAPVTSHSSKELVVLVCWS